MELGTYAQDLARAAINAGQSSSLTPRIDPTKTDRIAEARRAAEEFEAVFLAQMLAPMFENLGQDDLVGGGFGEGVYRSLLVEEYGKAISRSGGVGIAEAVQREILKLQEIKE